MALSLVSWRCRDGVATLDGSAPQAVMYPACLWQKFRVVTLPSIIPELLVVILTAIIGAPKTFAPVYLLTKGGPGTATTVPSYYCYNQFFQVQQVGYGAAISTAPTISVLFMFFFVWTWNEYTIPMAFLMSDDVQTIPLALATTLASASLLSIIPTIIFFIIFQCKLSQGITRGCREVT